MSVLKSHLIALRHGLKASLIALGRAAASPVVRAGVSVAVLAALVLLPDYGSDGVIEFAIDTLLLAVMAQSWNIIGGYAGYASFGNSVFYGLGAYAVAIAMVKFHQPFWIGMVCGAVIGVLFAITLGILVLRLKGHYFAIATLTLPLVVKAIVSNMPLADRSIGLVLPPVNNAALFYWLALGLLTLTTLTVWWLTRSRFGFGLIAIRENEEGAAVMGVNTTLYKVAAFALSGLFTALAGGIYAYKIAYLDPDAAFDISLNVKMIIMAVFGGPGTVLGPIGGALVLAVLSDWLATVVTSVAGLFFGVVVVVAVVLMPRGVADVIRRFPKAGWRYFIDNLKAHRV